MGGGYKLRPYVGLLQETHYKRPLQELEGLEGTETALPTEWE